LLRIDAHQHFWQYDPVEYGWIPDSAGVLRRDYLPAQLKPLLSAHGLDGAVAVQARQTLAENDFLLKLADENDVVKAVVGWVDLRSPDAEEQLERYAAHPKFRGVRHVVQDEPDDAFLLRDDFRRGIELLAAFGLTYDILIYHRHLPFAVELVKRYPNQPFILDHIAKPDIKNGTIAPWDGHIRQLAAYGNVSCKLSGMVTEADWSGWKADDFKPYLDVITEAFGPERLMIGSDWPVCTLSADYGTTMGIVMDYIKNWDEDSREAVLGRNCAKVYGIQ
jgi:L-fuconolactonase